VRRRISPSNFIEVFGFVIVHGTLDSTEASIVIVVQDGWYFEISDLMVVQESAWYKVNTREGERDG